MPGHPNIVGQPMLAHKAVHEAHVAAEVIAGELQGNKELAAAAFNARVIPSVAYTDPEVAWVGLTEDQAKAQGIKVKKGLFPWTASGRAIANGRDEGVTKLLFDDSPEAHGHGKILGGGIVGTHAGDMIGEIALAIEMGADAVDIGKTIHPHPTLGESIGMAAEAAHGTCTDLPPPQLGQQIRAVGVGLEHGGVLVAQQELDAPVLRALEAAAPGQIRPDGAVLGRRHRGQHVPGVHQLLHDARHAGQHLEGLGGAVVRNGAARGVQFMQRKAHPQFGRLVLDNEQHFVMRAGQQALGIKDAVDLQIVAIGHAAVERHLRALAGGVIGGHETLRRCEGKGASGDAAPPVQYRKIADLPPQASPA
eukprot:gene40600-49501_t